MRWSRPNLRAALTAVVAVAAAMSVNVASADASTALQTGDMVRLARIEYGCTTGFTREIRTPTAVISIAVTAGHCSPTTSAAAYRGLELDPVGKVIRKRGLNALDYAAIRVPGAVKTTPIASPGPVGSSVCKFGRITGITCGPIVAVTDLEITAKLRILPGDSGGGAVDAFGRTIGIVSRTNIDHGLVPVWTAVLSGKPMLVVFPRADRIVADLATLGDAA